MKVIKYFANLFGYPKPKNNMEDLKLAVKSIWDELGTYTHLGYQVEHNCLFVNLGLENFRISSLSQAKIDIQTIKIVRTSVSDGILLEIRSELIPLRSHTVHYLNTYLSLLERNNQLSVAHWSIINESGKLFYALYSHCSASPFDPDKFKVHFLSVLDAETKFNKLTQ